MGKNIGKSVGVCVGLSAKVKRLFLGNLPIHCLTMRVLDLLLSFIIASRGVTRAMFVDAFFLLIRGFQLFFLPVFT